MELASSSPKRAEEESKEERVKETKETEEDYSQAIIYFFKYGDDYLYIGSDRTKKERLWHHKSRFESDDLYFYTYCEEKGITFNDLIYSKVDYPCDNRQQLRRKEGEYQRELKPICNKEIAGRTDAEWRIDNREALLQKKHQYYTNNKEKVVAKINEWRADNKDYILERDRKYYHDNKEIIKQKKKVKVDCDCGLSISKSDMAKHLKTKRHLEIVSMVEKMFDTEI